MRACSACGMPWPWSLTSTSTRSSTRPDADRDAGPAAGVVDRVADQVADRRGRAARRRRRPWRRRSATTASSISRASATSRLWSTASRRRAADVDQHRARAGCRRPAAATGRRSPAPAGSAGSLSTFIRLANRATASGSSLASRTASASRAMPPTGVFSSWLTLATKSRRTSSTRRALVRSSTRSSTWRAAERGDARRDGDPAPAERAPGQVELGLADHAVAPDLPGQVPQLGVGQLRVADQAVGDARPGWP